MRLFIGAAPNGEDAESQAVLEYTLRKRASQPLDITWLTLNRDKAHPCGGWRTDQWNTPFTPLRWAIPAGWPEVDRAIYMDCDILVLGDIAELWDQDLGGKAALIQTPDQVPVPRTCVMLMDCQAMRSVLPPLKALKASVQPSQLAHKAMRGRFGAFRGKWNCVDLKETTLADRSLRAVHYSSIPHQLHARHARARLARQHRAHWFDGKVHAHWRPELQALFDKLLAEATAAGYAPAAYDPGRVVTPFRMRSYKSYA